MLTKIFFHEESELLLLFIIVSPQPQYKYQYIYSNNNSLAYPMAFMMKKLIEFHKIFCRRIFFSIDILLDLSCLLRLSLSIFITLQQISQTRESVQVKLESLFRSIELQLKSNGAIDLGGCYFREIYKLHYFDYQ